jgi:pimeloyl-ACP methyl ester carboxylesterase
MTDRSRADTSAVTVADTEREAALTAAPRSRASALTVEGGHVSNRSPVPAIIGSLAAGGVLAIALVLGPASAASEPVITGSVLLAFGFGWGLMALLSSRFSAQPQRWTAVPAAVLALVGLGLIAFQPGPAAMDLLSWVWPPALAVLAVWMFVQVRRHLGGRGRWLLVPVIGTLLVAALGGGLTTVSAATHQAVSVGPGQLVDVGGHRLYIECTGSGSPTVVLQSGLGASSADWALVTSAVARTTRVCAYDRAGHGRSDEVPVPQDGLALAADLHTLLDRAGVAKPYVLVGHSSGGPYVRVFAAQHPDEVAGMVLIDAQPPDAFAALPDYPGIYQSLRMVSTLAPSLARIGLLGLVVGLPLDEATPRAARMQRDEFAALPTALDQAKELTSLGDRPLIVVTAGSEQQAGWLAAQDVMPGLSTASVHRLMRDATHNSLVTGADAASSSQAILDVLASIRGGTPPR